MTRLYLVYGICSGCSGCSHLTGHELVRLRGERCRYSAKWPEVAAYSSHMGAGQDPSGHIPTNFFQISKSPSLLLPDFVTDHPKTTLTNSHPQLQDAIKHLAPKHPPLQSLWDWRWTNRNLVLPMPLPYTQVPMPWNLCTDLHSIPGKPKK